MKTEDLQAQGLSEEQINQLLNTNSADIGNAKKKLETDENGSFNLIYCFSFTNMI